MDRPYFWNRLPPGSPLKPRAQMNIGNGQGVLEGKVPWWEATSGPWRGASPDSCVSSSGLPNSCKLCFRSVPCALCDYTSCVCSLTSRTLPQPGRLSGQPLLPDQSALCPNLCLRPAKNQVHTDTSAVSYLFFYVRLLWLVENCFNRSNRGPLRDVMEVGTAGSCDPCCRGLKTETCRTCIPPSTA